MRQILSEVYKLVGKPVNLQIIYLYIKTYIILTNFSSSNLIKAKLIAKKLADKKFFIGYYFLGKIYFLQNKQDLSIKNLNLALQQRSYHADSIYLKSHILNLTGNKDKAWQLLINLTKHSSRRKSWQELSNLVTTATDFLKFWESFKQYYFDKQEVKLGTLPYDLACHLSNAAIRGNNEKFALNLWRQKFLAYKNNKSKHKNTIKFSKKYNNKIASTALKDLKQVMDQNDVTFFLISGTLLGCIREKSLLGHDKDIDIGVWQTVNYNDLINYFRSSGYFYILPSQSQDLLVIRHINGVTIDIFIHYQDKDNYWHKGCKSKWNNTPFKLAETYFLGDRYLIPANFDLYLTENYGDWQKPKIIFDSTLDTPNIEILNIYELKIYFYKKLINKKLTPNLFKRIYNELIKHGEKLD